MATERPHFLKDLEVRQIQSLDHGKLSASVLQGIRLASPPFRIALFGPWGSGKTTILKMVQDSLPTPSDDSDEDFFRTVWFNAWEHESSANLFHSLILGLVEAIPDGVRYSRKGSGVVARVLEAARTHGRRWHGTSVAESAPESASAVGLASIRDDLERFVDMLLVAGKRGRGRRLVLFVDDLDKCLPRHTLALLESLKLFFGGSTAIVVICCIDADVLRRVVRAKYGHATSAFAESYIEKIFEFSYNVPVIATSQVNGLVGEIYRRSGLGARSVTEEQKELEREVIERVLSRPGLTLSPRRIKHVFNRFIWFLCQPEALDEDAFLDADSLDAWLTWLLATEYWRGLPELVERFGETAFKEIGNRVTGHPLFPHSNELCKVALEELHDARALIDFVRGCIELPDDAHLPEAQEAMRRAVMRLMAIDRALRSHGL